ncbi:hypothetical protein ACWCYZ_00810 [Streptomyces virginiae]|uniref:hypothetical protein n=1 Tax=Streptomyces TaxID=1883 RepID=UPI000F3A8961|nr:hypothetical protein [Streptomyces sp. ADI95-16]AYV29660.1 hypothetical protein EES41_23370 [Streptomyces sp. ADI95-16]
MANPRPRKLAKPNGAAVKARGRNWENELVQVFRDLGYADAKRNGAIYGSADRGDIGGVPLTVQAKAVDRIQLWKHLDESIAQAQRNGTGLETCVIYKRHGASTIESAWVIPGAFAMRLLHAYYSS